MKNFLQRNRFKDSVGKYGAGFLKEANSNCKTTSGITNYDPSEVNYAAHVNHFIAQVGGSGALLVNNGTSHANIEALLANNGVLLTNSGA